MDGQSYSVFSGILVMPPGGSTPLFGTETSRSAEYKIKEIGNEFFLGIATWLVS